MSNYYEVMTAAKTADCICYCFSGDNEWTLNSYQHTLDIAFRDNSSNSNSRSRKSKKQKTQTATTTPQINSIPIILIQTKSEKGSLESAKVISKEKKYPLIETSALEGTSIEECFKLISEAILSSSPKKQQVKEVKEENNSTVNANETKTEVPVSTKSKETTIWNKLMAKFLGKLQDKAEKNRNN